MKTNTDTYVRLLEQAEFHYNEYLSEEDRVHLSSRFINALADRSFKQKTALRQILQKHSAYNPELDLIQIPALIEQDHNLLYHEQVQAVKECLEYVFDSNKPRVDLYYDAFLGDVISLQWISRTFDVKDPYSMKPSRLLRKVCDKMGITDKQGFEKQFAITSDLLNSKPKSITLNISCNPAYLITSSNPIEDVRGRTLTSCHSLNNRTEYVTGAISIALDPVSFIVWTAQSNNGANFNRKTSRQLYAYDTSSRLLLQSRYYSTSGGMTSETATEVSKQYRNIVQRIVAYGAGIPDKWKTQNAAHSGFVTTHPDYQGYCDWNHDGFGAKVSYPSDSNPPSSQLIIGQTPICTECGQEFTPSASNYTTRCNDCD